MKKSYYTNVQQQHTHTKRPLKRSLLDRVFRSWMSATLFLVGWPIFFYGQSKYERQHKPKIIQPKILIILSSDQQDALDKAEWE